MAEKSHEQVDATPDPDEDDLDDLDDVLDDFQPTATTATKPAPAPAPAPSASGPGRPPSSQHNAAPQSQVIDPGEADLAFQLQAGMANLMSELDSNPDMQNQFEQMMQELIAAGAAPTDQEAGRHLRQAAEAVPKASTEALDSSAKAMPASSGSGSGSTKKTGGSSGGAGAEENFSSTIRKTMARMQASDSTASASAAEPAAHEQTEEDLLATMMKELQSSGGGEGGEEDFNKILMNMMTQLTNKEILYEPMKELDEKFPAWMERHEKGGEGVAEVGAEDMQRYREQQRLVGEIVGRFERKRYSDDDEGDREYIVERMQKMQSAGSPPPDLVGDMSAAQEALGDMDAGCPTQ